MGISVRDDLGSLGSNTLHKTTSQPCLNSIWALIAIISLTPPSKSFSYVLPFPHWSYQDDLSLKAVYVGLMLGQPVHTQNYIELSQFKLI